MSSTADTGDTPPARLARAARAAEELCGALWEALHEDLRRPEPQRAADVAELAQRLAEICSAIATLAARAGRTPEPAREPPTPPEAPEIEIHDTRREVAGGAPSGIGGDQGPIAWAAAIGASAKRYAVDALPFAVLLMEVIDVERLAQAESPVALGRLMNRLEGAVRQELRPADAIVRESPGRWWVTASRTDAHGARTLAERLAATARTAASHRDAPLELTIGVAVCPADGSDPAALAAHADVGLYAARAAGRTMAPEEGLAR